MLDEKLLEIAAARARNSLLLHEYPEDAQLPVHVFSKTFERKMRSMLSRSKKFRFYNVARRAAVILLACMVGLSVCILSVEAWRNQLFRMVERKFPRYSEILYEPVNPEVIHSHPNQKLLEYRPGYIPPGYLLTEQLLDDGINWMTYSNDADNIITFHQSLLGTSVSGINTEGSELTKFNLNGYEAYKMTNRGAHFVLWSDDCYEFMVITDESAMTLEQSIKVAQSVAPAPKDAYHPPRFKTEMSELPAIYSEQQATANGDVVINVTGIVANRERLEEFINNAADRKVDIVRIADYTTDGPVIWDLFSDGLRIQSTQDSTRVLGMEESGTFSNQHTALLREEQGGRAVYVLINSEGERTELFAVRLTK